MIYGTRIHIGIVLNSSTAAACFLEQKISIVEENVYAGLIRKNAAAASKERGGERESRERALYFIYCYARFCCLLFSARL